MLGAAGEDGGDLLKVSVLLTRSFVTEYVTTMKSNVKRKLDPKVNVERVTIWRRKVKAILVEALGGKCQLCGYDRLPVGFDFHHHFGPKLYSISSMISNIRRTDLILEEASKCVLLCANCHREVHEGVSNIPDDIKRLDVDLARTLLKNSLKYRKNRVDDDHIKKTLRIVRSKVIGFSKKGRPGYENKSGADPIYEKRKIIRLSGIDFSRHGWVKEVGVLLEITPQAAGRWMRKNMPEFYKNRCFSRK